jgi:pyroglutamyl-peptidase
VKVLVCGFKGNTNSAKVIVDKIDSKNISEKLYLVNSFETSKKQLECKLESEEYDLVIAFGQKPKVKSINLEQKACINGHELITNYEYDKLVKLINSSGFIVNVSNNAGNYLCNHIFYMGLMFINKNELNTKMIFIHIPSIKNIENMEHLAGVFARHIDNLAQQL